VKIVGPHRVTNLNIIHPGVNELFDDGRKASILYSDPPWGEGNTKYWATMARKTGQNVETVTYEALIGRIFDLVAKFVSEHVFIETGLRWKNDTLERMARVGLKNIEATDLTYGGGFQNALLFGSFVGGVGDLSRVKGMAGGKVAELAIQSLAREGDILFDPCCGMGYSARAALLNGMQFRGNELNAQRLQKTIARLENGLSHSVAA
jgi:hypothetical protein